MTILDTFRKEKMEAYKNKETVKNGVLSLLIAAMILKEKETHEPISNEDAMAIIQKELKQTKESLDSTPATREDLIALETQKIHLLESYLPKQLTLEEVKVAMSALLEEKQIELTLKNKGLIMKSTMEALKGRTDGKVIGIVLGLLMEESK